MSHAWIGITYLTQEEYVRLKASPNKTGRANLNAWGGFATNETVTQAAPDFGPGRMIQRSHFSPLPAKRSRHSTKKTFGGR